jgi:hypothetical protein
MATPWATFDLNDLLAEVKAPTLVVRSSCMGEARATFWRDALPST